MRLLQRNADVETRYGGGFVQCIDGLSGGRAAGAASTGSSSSTAVEAREGAGADEASRGGDRVWWDRRDVGRRPQRVPAVVGSFPEPFVHGLDGEAPAGARRVRCELAVDRRATRCATRSSTFGVPASKGDAAPLERRARRCASSSAPWPALRGDNALRAARGRAGGERRLRASRGPTGAASRCSTPRGDAVRALGAGAGLSRRPRPATSRRSGSSPAPTTRASLAAARAFGESALRDRFASRSTTGGVPAAARRRAGAVIYRAAPARCTPRAPASPRPYCAALDRAARCLFEHPARARRASRSPSLGARRSRGVGRAGRRASRASRCRSRCSSRSSTRSSCARG